MKVSQIQPTAQIKQPIIKRIKKALIKPFAKGCAGGRIIFSKEDQKIIDKLPAEDAIKYIGKLINEKKYKFPE